MSLLHCLRAAESFLVEVVIHQIQAIQVVGNLMVPLFQETYVALEVD